MKPTSAPAVAAPVHVTARRVPSAAAQLSRRHLLRGAARLGMGGAGLLLLAGCGQPTAGLGPANRPTRLGVLASEAGPNSPAFPALRQGLAELGYVEGKNLAFEYRLALGDLALLQQFAAELVALPVDVLIPHGLLACSA